MPDILEQDRELVPADTGNRHFGVHAGDGIHCSDAAFQPIGDCGEEAIPGFMAKAVVHELEPIQIHEENRRDAALPLGPFHRLSEAIEKQHAIRQAGQRIRHLAFGDVGERPGHAMRPARGVPDGDAAREHPTVRAVGMQHAVLALEVWREPFEVRRDVSPQSVDIIPVDSSEPLVRNGGN